MKASNAAEEVEDKYRLYNVGQKKAFNFLQDDRGNERIANVLEKDANDDVAKAYIETLNGMFETSERSYTLYRGMSKTATDNRKSFTSLTTDATTAGVYARSRHNEEGEIRVYRIPKGTPILKLGGVSYEIVLPQNFNLKKYRVK